MEYQFSNMNVQLMLMSNYELVLQLHMALVRQVFISMQIILVKKIVFRNSCIFPRPLESIPTKAVQLSRMVF